MEVISKKEGISLAPFPPASQGEFSEEVGEDEDGGVDMCGD